MKRFIVFILIILLNGCLSFPEVKKEHYPSGELKIEYNYKNNRLEGITKWYYESGEILYIDTYKNGQKINRKAYDERGKLDFDQDYPYTE